MGYYDSIKDSVKNQNNDTTQSKSNDSGGPKPAKAPHSSGGFDTLKKAASEESEESKKSNDTPIEVLEEGLNQPQKPSNQSSQRTGSNPFQKEENNSSGSQANVSSKGLEKKLDRIIEQNAKMIEILESFGN